MPAIRSISSDKLLRLVGTPGSPAILDVRPAADFDGRFVPGALRRDGAAVAEWASGFAGKSAVVICQHGGARSEGVAAWLRHAGVDAELLEGGAQAWAAAGYPMVPEVALPPRDPRGRTIWVTRARPKVDRIACPWLIRRFVDPDAVFLFVSPSEVSHVAETFAATPFDVAGVRWSHDGDRCTFDAMVDAFGLAALPALAHLARIVRGADTARPDLVPEAAGLLALSLGLSRLYADDLEQLNAGMLLYDALYRWCRDARGETHDWTAHQAREPRA
ncbi:MAG: sulfurtransferase [Sphingomonadales bacterium]|nr:MAG: sulfurtransferase [Sphingomonadales bacterium]